MEEALWRLLEKEVYWGPKDRLLVAVSGGVDSMVLLKLLTRLPQHLRPAEVGVAHFNHDLRAESVIEAEGVASFCQQHRLPCYLGKWQVQQVENGLEASAREARYEFLLATAKHHDYSLLLTAHHGDDQVETLLMKLIRGSSIQNMVGIRPVSWREGIKIVRPLLGFKKSLLEQWATQQRVSYWEDKSNHEDDYLRNRIRHHIVPHIAAESPNYIEKCEHFTWQLRLVNDMMTTRIKELYPLCVETPKQVTDEERLNILTWRNFSEAEQYFLLNEFFQRNLIVKGGELSQRQLQKIMTDLTVDGEQVWMLANKWQVYKSYHFLKVSKISSESSFKITGVIESVGEKIKTSATDSLVLEAGSTLPQTMDEVLIPAEWLPLTVRSYQEGDYFVLDSSGNTKKVARYFIDKKIPKAERLQVPIVLNNQGEIVWIVGLRKSYLSIVPETDKIFYKLTYYKK